MDREILYRFFEGTASFEEEERVCQWADASEKNRQELIQERKCFDMQLFYQASVGDKKQVARYSLWPALKIAAAIAVLLVCGVHLFMLANAEEEPMAMNTIVVPPGQRVNLTLSDGTNVWLNACSEMRYPSTFGSRQRSVWVNGEAYFNITHDTKHPFIVETKKCDIKVLGTQFNVQVEELQSEFSLALLEGSVELMSKVGNDPHILLQSLQLAEWKQGRFVVDSIRDFDSFRWKEGLICFEDIRFTDLMARFERIYDIRILVDNEKLKEYKCNGKCRVSDGVDFILQVLQRNWPFEFTRNEDNTVIYIK